MKQDKHRFLRKRRGRKPGKAGSSLALVMMIGAALVIWVMCIMPLMTTTGTTAIQTEEKYDDYLESRSSIEYCKSELEDIVTREIPYTFAVVRNDDDTFKAIRRNDKDTGYLDDTPGGYQTYVSVPDPNDATQDKPKDDANGNKVTAICVVEWNSTENQYDITITSYHNGEPGQTFSLIFTPSGSLLIFPEAYNKAQALPLSDFVVVDGKLGSTLDEEGNTVVNRIWDSTINMSNAVNTSDKTTGDFEEYLKAWKKDPEVDYASSQEYPAVFKKTAQAAEYDDGAPTLGLPLNNGEFSSDKTWYVPAAVSADSAKNPGNIWIVTTSTPGEDIKVYLYTSESTEITSQCTIYLNGNPCTDKKVPTQEGKYCVTVDYPGTGDYSDSKVNVLPVTGLRMPDTVGKVGGNAQNLPDCSVESVVKDGDTYTVTLSGSSYSDMLYGYCSDDPDAVVTWTDVNRIEGLAGGKTYYFYIFRPAAMKDGTFYAESEVKYVGMIYPRTFVKNLTNGKEYLVLGKDEKKYYAMRHSSSGNNLRASQITLNSDFLIPSSDIDDLAWTAQKNSDKWSFCYDTTDPKSYLTMSQKWGQGYLSTGEMDDSNSSFTVTQYNGGASVCRPKPSKRDYDFYLRYDSWNQRFTASVDSRSTIYFLEVPVDNHPSVPSPTAKYTSTDYSMVYGSSAMNNVQPPKVENVTLDKLYANGTEITETTAVLNAGVYNLTADVNDTNILTADVNDTNTGFSYCVALGKLTVTKAALQFESSENKLEVASCTADSNDEMKVCVTGSGWHIDTNNGDIGGTNYFGYRDVNNSADTDFHWFYSDGESFTFRLPYGTYAFAVRESGSNNYADVTSASSEFTISPTPVILAGTEPSKFVYTRNSETGEVTWYKLPQNVAVKDSGKTVSLLPCRVQLVFGVPVGETGIAWQKTYNDNVSFYGVIVENSDCADLEHVLKISPPANISISNGHTSSMMRGSSLYFMGQGNSINTYGNDIYLTTDLLVLNYDITGGGHVFVTPYSTGEGTSGNTLLFTVHAIERDGETIFKEKTFYKIEPNTDINNISAANAASLECGKITDTVDSNIQYLFRQGIYPEINLDIAYANDKQLAHILSSETIGWTVMGELCNSDNNNANSAYVVCTYVNKVNNEVSCKANRILIAAKDSDISHTLNVPYDLTFTTRYLSIDAQDVVQADGSANFVIKSLGQDQNFLSWLSTVAKLTSFHSKTLQIDYEQKTAIHHADTSITSVDKQICRYDNGTDGTDLFANPTIQPLMVTYMANEINGWYGNLSQAAKIVDRYVAFKGDETSSKIDMGALATCTLDIYTNYLYIDGSINEISVSGLLDNDIRIRSQESGYSDKEYLGLFTEHSTESYNGTLVYVAEKVGFSYTYIKWVGFFPIPETGHAEIQPGFYYIYSLDGGTSLKTLATDLFTGDKLEENTEKKPFKVDPKSLKDYSIYIDKDGNISNAYVDTGLFDNSSIGLGGFSGGKVG